MLQPGVLLLWAPGLWQGRLHTQSAATTCTPTTVTGKAAAICHLLTQVAGCPYGRLRQPIVTEHTLAMPERCVLPRPCEPRCNRNDTHSPDP
jgi:hypothetical protein